MTVRNYGLVKLVVLCCNCGVGLVCSSLHCRPSVGVGQRCVTEVRWICSLSFQNSPTLLLYIYYYKYRDHLTNPLVLSKLYFEHFCTYLGFSLLLYYCLYSIKVHVAYVIALLSRLTTFTELDLLVSTTHILAFD